MGVFSFEDPLNDLQKVGGGFVPKEDTIQPEQSDPENFTIMQGYLEQSNVSAIEEMISLIEVSRAHDQSENDTNF